MTRDQIKGVERDGGCDQEPLNSYSLIALNLDHRVGTKNAQEVDVRARHVAVYQNGNILEPVQMHKVTKTWQILTKPMPKMIAGKAHQVDRVFKGFWIFIRPNAVGESGALQRYGTGIRGEFNMERV